MKKFELVTQPGPKEIFERLAKAKHNGDGLQITCEGYEPLALIPQRTLIQLLELAGYNVTQKN